MNLVIKPQWKLQFGILRIRWDILLDSLSERGREGVVFIRLNESQARWQAVVNTIKKFVM